jgi:hypothetical protein
MPTQSLSSGRFVGELNGMFPKGASANLKHYQLYYNLPNTLVTKAPVEYPAIDVPSLGLRT